MKFTVFLASLLLHTAANAAVLPTLPVEKLRAQLGQTISIVFNDESEALYGDLLSHDLHLDKVCEAIKALAKDKPRAIFIDMDIAIAPEAAKCIAEAGVANGIRLTADYDPLFLSQDLRMILRSISIGSAMLATKVVAGQTVEARPNKARWLNPSTRVSLVKPAAVPYIQPAYFINLVNGLDDQALRSVHIPWARAVMVADFTEVDVPKIAIQDILAGRTETVAGKYTFIGVDQDKYDAMSSAGGEVINGVFLHQQFTAAYLALMAEDLGPAPGSLIIFGEFSEDLATDK
jgi:hypothetical protein